MRYLVSIITPFYNSTDFIQQCIESVIAQTYTNWEMIIIDDYSQKNQKKRLQMLCEKDSRIKIFFSTKNIGPSKARNIGLKEAKGRYIAFLDSDDFWAPKKLEKQIFFMQKRGIAFSYTTYQSISEDGKKIYSVIKANDEINYYSYLKNTIIGCLTVIIDRDITGNFEMPNIRSSHDMALWLLIMKRGFNAYGLNDNLASYRIVSNSNTSRKIEAARDVWKVYREIEKLSFFYSTWCFIHYVFNAVKKRI
tara:strand:- start:3908 stop:4657 length:750 start_codon:yes stop_codon:yes gene_type:complete